MRWLRRALLWVGGGFFVTTLVAVLLLRFIAPLTTSFIVGSYITAWRHGDTAYHARYHWTPYSDISRHAKLAVIASEDQKFAFHPGFDFDSIDRAMKDRERGKRLRGASTISQQVAKNLFLWSGQSFVRKGLEAYLTLLIELCWSKQRILEIYLNVAEFGPGIYGVGPAADEYFHKSASRLTQSEAALLAGVLPAPSRLHVTAPSAYLLGRRAWIIAQMNRLGGEAYIRSVDSNGAGER